MDPRLILLERRGYTRSSLEAVKETNAGVTGNDPLFCRISLSLTRSAAKCPSWHQE